MSNNCPKYFLFSMNLLVWIASVVVLGLALYFFTNVKDVASLFSGGVEFDKMPIAAIALGGAIFVVSFSGCCGAIKEWKWMLCLYLLFLLIIIGAESYFLYLVFSYRKDGRLTAKINEWMGMAFKTHKNEFQRVETLFKCCGATGVSDYSQPPTSCCNSPALNTCDPIEAYNGCGPVFAAYVDDYSKYAAYGMIAVGAVELVAVIASLTMIFCKNSNKFQRV